jgi:CRP-like cAMP-binding protein
MPTTPPTGRSAGQFGNRLLDALPSRDQARLQPHIERRKGDLKELLLDRGEEIRAVYFPVDAVVSVLTSMEDASGVEIATIGNEGMVGSPVFLGSSFMPAREFAQVQVPGELLRLDAAVLREEVSAEGPVRDVVQRYVQALFSQISQQVACNGLHSVEERCSRWLLLTHDQVGADEFPLTHEFLSQMLGVRRASVTLAAGALQNAGLIQYRRGQVTIRDRQGLEQTTCECYQVIRDEFDRLLGPMSPPDRSSGTAGKRGDSSQPPSH